VTRASTARHREELAAVWREFAKRECGTYSPLYAEISAAVAEDGDLLDLVLEAPPSAHQPNVLLAAVHYLNLDGMSHPLADIYAGQHSGEDIGLLFRDLCLSNRVAVLGLMRSRRTQTNECGRSAVLALGLTAAAAATGEPVGLLDAGASAGLNLLLDRYRLDYGLHGALGPAGSPVHVDCVVRSPSLPVPDRLPAIARRLGLDRTPVDLSNPDDVRWLLACVWPDTGRVERTSAAIDLAREQAVHMQAGDMVRDLGAALASFTSGPIAVVTSWAYAYLSPSERGTFCEVLAEEGHRRPVAWISAEGSGVVELLGPPPKGPDEETTPSVLGLVVYHKSQCDARSLALVHPHGNWIDWRDSV
jgi:hypothetical protein